MPVDEPVINTAREEVSAFKVDSPNCQGAPFGRTVILILLIYVPAAGIALQGDPPAIEYRTLMDMESSQPTPQRPPQPDWAEWKMFPDEPENVSNLPAAEPSLPKRSVGWPVMLFVLTCLSTYALGGWRYSLCLMTILVCHEAGHFIQAWRYGVYASLPLFLPMPVGPIGTLGALIRMEAGVGDRKAIYDIGISGPLAGLVPTLVFLVIGLQTAEYKLVEVLPGGVQIVGGPFVPSNEGYFFGEPLVFRWVRDHAAGRPPEVPEAPIGKTYRYECMIGTMAQAGWVGLLITSLNLFPIGQLDGGHVLYALLRRRSHFVAWFIMGAAAIAILIGAVVFHHQEVVGWLVMLSILLAMGPRHPPTADDEVPLGWPRAILGWLTLAFVFIGFTPTPFL